MNNKYSISICFFRFLGVVGHHEDEFPIERLDVNTTGEIVASISHDNRWVTLVMIKKQLLISTWQVPCGYKLAAI